MQKEFKVNKNTNIKRTDVSNHNNVEHHYYVYENVPNNSVSGYCETHYADISFQCGPIKEKGVNGCHLTDILAICIDQLEQFQSTKFACRENAIAKTKLEEAMMWLNKRTADRIARNVEGTDEV